jgi:hypothetical protein
MKLKLARAGMVAALGAPAFASPADVQTNGTSHERASIEESVTASHGDKQIVSRAFFDDEPTSDWAMISYAADREWTDDDEHPFHQLAIGEALGELSPEQMTELESLTALRARKSSETKTLDEILQEIRQWKAATSLLSQLNNYVKVVGSGT